MSEITLLNTCWLCRREEELWGCVATGWPHYTLFAKSSRRGRWRQLRAFTQLWLACTRSGKSSDTSHFWQNGHTQLFNRKSLWLWLSRGKHTFLKRYYNQNQLGSTVVYMCKKWLAKNWPTHLCLTRNNKKWTCLFIKYFLQNKASVRTLQIIWIQTLVLGIWHFKILQNGHSSLIFIRFPWSVF